MPPKTGFSLAKASVFADDCDPNRRPGRVHRYSPQHRMKPPLPRVCLVAPGVNPVSLGVFDREDLDLALPDGLAFVLLVYRH